VRDERAAHAAIRMIIHLRHRQAQLELPRSFPAGRIQEIIGTELGLTDAAVQTNGWHCELAYGAAGCLCTVHMNFLDDGMQRSFVRLHVYERARQLCEAAAGTPDARTVAESIRLEIRYGSDAPNPHSVHDALRYGSGVCQAISAYATQLLLRCGIPALQETGTVAGVPHGWNLFRERGQWRTLDCCGPMASPYRPNNAGPPEQRFRQLLFGLDRAVDFSADAAKVGSLRPPVCLGGKGVLVLAPFLAAFNGAMRIHQSSAVVSFGSVSKQLPLATLAESPRHQLAMAAGAFAERFQLHCQNDLLRFKEPL